MSVDQPEERVGPRPGRPRRHARRQPRSGRARRRARQGGEDAGEPAKPLLLAGDELAGDQDPLRVEGRQGVAQRLVVERAAGQRRGREPRGGDRPAGVRVAVARLDPEQDPSGRPGGDQVIESGTVGQVVAEVVGRQPGASEDDRGIFAARPFREVEPNPSPGLFGVEPGEVDPPGLVAGRAGFQARRDHGEDRPGRDLARGLGQARVGRGDLRRPPPQPGAPAGALDVSRPRLEPARVGRSLAGDPRRRAGLKRRGDEPGERGVVEPRVGPARQGRRRPEPDQRPRQVRPGFASGDRLGDLAGHRLADPRMDRLVRAGAVEAPPAVEPGQPLGDRLGRIRRREAGQGPVKGDVDPGRRPSTGQDPEQEVEPIGAGRVLVGLPLEAKPPGSIGQPLGQDHARGPAVGEVRRQVPGLGERVDPARILAAAEPIERMDAGQVQPERPARRRRDRGRGQFGQLGQEDRPDLDGTRGPSVDQDQDGRFGVGPDRPRIGSGRSPLDDRRPRGAGVEHDLPPPSRPAAGDHRHAERGGMAARDRHGQAVRPVGVRHPEGDRRPGQAGRVGRTERGRVGQGPVEPAFQAVPERGVDQGGLGDGPGGPARRVQGRPARRGRAIPPGAGRVDRVDLDADRRPVDLRGGGGRGGLRADDRQGQAASRRGRLGRVPAAADPPAESGPRRVAQRLPGRLDLEDVSPLGTSGGDRERVRGRPEGVGGDHFPPLGPPDRVAPSDRPQLGRAVEVDLGRLGGEDVERHRERDQAAGLARAVRPRLARSDLDRVPGQPFDPDLEARPGRALGTFEQGRERDPSGLSGDLDHQFGPERPFEPDPRPPLRARADEPDAVRPGLRDDGRSRASEGLDNPPFGERDLGRRRGGGRRSRRRREGRQGRDVPVDLDGHPGPADPASPASRGSTRPPRRRPRSASPQAGAGRMSRLPVRIRLVQPLGPRRHPAPRLASLRAGGGPVEPLVFSFEVPTYQTSIDRSTRDLERFRKMGRIRRPSIAPPSRTTPPIAPLPKSWARDSSCPFGQNRQNPL